VRKELLDADVVLPSLDAASNVSFRKINRPDPTIDIEEYIKGICDFRNEFKGKIWLEILLIPGYNNSKADLISLKDAIEKIRPDSIQLNTLDRPGAIEGIHASTRNELQKIVDYWNLGNVEIIASAPDRKSIKSYREDIETAILETICRRPCTVGDLANILGSHINQVNKYLDVLEAEEKIESVQQDRGLFYHLNPTFTVSTNF